MEFDPEGNIWIGMSYQAGASKIDRKTKTCRHLSAAEGVAGRHQPDQHGDATHMDVDGKVWMEDTENGRVFRLDIATGKWEDAARPPRRKAETIRGYGLPADKDNNLYLMSFGDTRIGRLDAKTMGPRSGRPPMTRSRPRRGRFDDQESAVVRRICRQSHRHVRSQDRTDQRMEAADRLEPALRRGADERRRGGVDRVDA